MLKVQVGKFSVELDSVDTLLDLVEKSEQRDAVKGKATGSRSTATFEAGAEPIRPVEEDASLGSSRSGRIRAPRNYVTSSITSFPEDKPSPLTVPFLKALKEREAIRTQDYFREVGITGTSPISKAMKRIESDILRFSELDPTSVLHYGTRKIGEEKVKRWFPEARIDDAIRALEGLKTSGAESDSAPYADLRPVEPNTS